MNKLLTPGFIFVSSAILLAAIVRLLITGMIPNFAPIGAMALFGGAYLSNKRLAIILPLIAMFISDLFLELHDTMLYVYISFALITLIGVAIRNSVSTGTVVIASLLSSVLFFLLTNFGVWLQGTLYPRSLGGLIECYAAAIPFYRHNLFGSFALNTVMGDLFFNGILFGSFYLARQRFPLLARI